LEQKVRTAASEDPPSPCAQNVCTGQISLIADVFYGRSLTLIIDFSHFCIN